MGQVNITAYLQYNNIMSFLTRVHVRDKAAVEFKEFLLLYCSCLLYHLTWRMFNNFFFAMFSCFFFLQGFFLITSSKIACEINLNKISCLRIILHLVTVLDIGFGGSLNSFKVWPLRFQFGSDYLFECPKINLSRF